MNSDTLAITLDRVKFYAHDAFVTLTQVRRSSLKLADVPVSLSTVSSHSRILADTRDATLKINGRSYRIEKLLGEGGFSFVYLIRDESSGRQCALKKILVTTGTQGVKEAMREVEAYRRFKHPNIIRILDSAVVQDAEGDGKIIYL
jgi:serine/threonine kinase 16